MDRTDELLRIASIFIPAPEEGGTVLPGQQGQPPSLRPHQQQLHAYDKHQHQQPSHYQRLALQVSTNLDSNDLLMKRMEVLAGRKEFSNDPTADMSEISDLFQRKAAVIKHDMEQLKRLSNAHDQGNGQGGQGGLHQQQHYKLVFQALNKRMLGHIESFQQAVKMQASLAEQRLKRVSDKYGQGTAQMSHVSRYAAASQANTQGLLVAGHRDGSLSPRPQLSNASASSANGAISHSNSNSNSNNNTTNTIAAAASNSSRSNTNTNSNSNSTLQASQASAAFAPAPAAMASYAMFNPSHTQSHNSSYSQNQGLGQGQMQGLSHELRRRGGSHVHPSSAASSSQSQSSSHSSSSSSSSSYMQQQIHQQQNQSQSQAQHQYHQQQQYQQQQPKSHSRLKLASKAEAQIAQMGQLFQQMASLVVEQSETISRIEDDVESGLVDTKEGHKHLMNYYEISKGNRSLIAKIFLLLVGFVVLFCWYF